MRMKTEERTNDELRAAFSYLRKSRKVRLKDLAEAGGCTTRHLSAILSEKDRRGMSGDLAKAMAAYFGLTYDLFLTLGQLIMAGVPGEEASKRVTPITDKGHIEQSILVSGTAEVGHPAFGESMSRWLAGKTENERYEIAKAGLVSLGTPSSAVVRVLAGAIEMPPGLLNSLPQELAQRFDAIWSYVCGADALHSSWQERYRTHYTAGQMTDSEVYIAAHEWLSTQKKW